MLFVESLPCAYFLRIIIEIIEILLKACLLFIDQCQNRRRVSYNLQGDFPPQRCYCMPSFVDGETVDAGIV